LLEAPWIGCGDGYSALWRNAGGVQAAACGPGQSSLTLFRELIEAVKRYGRPQFVQTDNEAVFVSRWFRVGLWLLGIPHQRTEPGCPWQNGQVEPFIGTVKRALARAVITIDKKFNTTLRDVRTWYNHDRSHDHLQGRTSAEVWAGIDIFTAKPGSCEECEANSLSSRTEHLSVIPTDECAQKTMNTEKGCTNAKKSGRRVRIQIAKRG
jgi:hypothetical protein